jgi:hypothetical protein
MKRILHKSVYNLFFIFIFSILFAPTSYAQRFIHVDSITNGQITWHLTDPDSFSQGVGRVCDINSSRTRMTRANGPDDEIYYPFLTCDDNGATFSAIEGGLLNGIYSVNVRTTPKNVSWNSSEPFYIYNNTMYPSSSINTGTVSATATVTEENGIATVYPSNFTGAFSSLNPSDTCVYAFSPIGGMTGTSPDPKLASCSATQISFTWDNPGNDAYVTTKQYLLGVEDHDMGGISHWQSNEPISLTLE